MPRPFEHWHVLPHDKLTEVDTGILTVVGRGSDLVGARARAEAAAERISFRGSQRRHDIASHAPVAVGAAS